jgi:hypothetical protein
MDFWQYLRANLKFWLLPTLVCLVVLGVLAILNQGSAIAPFVYTLF